MYYNKLSTVINKGARSSVAGVATVTPVSKAVWQEYPLATPVFQGVNFFLGRRPPAQQLFLADTPPRARQFRIIVTPVSNCLRRC